MEQNPWNVDSIEAFTFLKCPECNFDTEENDKFRDHALENHPMSFVFFHDKLKEEPFDVKMELLEDTVENEEKYMGNTYEKWNLDPLSMDAKENILPATENLNSCSFCQNSFQGKKDLQKHVLTTHKNFEIIKNSNRKWKSEEILLPAVDVKKIYYLGHKK